MTPEQSAHHFQETFEKIRGEISKFIVGQYDIVENVLISIICGGHVLLEGVPGLGKTALVNTIAKALHLKFQRIQFTPDLLPADVVGTQILVDKGGQKVFDFQPGPVFCNVLLADEINRATPKTQSALLETMQEKTVTVANTTHRLAQPFFVLATQNPIENEGTYPLPEAQLDRFFFKLFVEVPSHDDFVEILNRTTGNKPPEISAVATGEDIIQMGATLRDVPIAREIQDYLVKVVRNTHPTEPTSPLAVKNYIRHGSSPRGAQTILTAARARALLKGRFHVSKDDVNAVAVAALRHRMILSFEGEAEGVRTEAIINDIIEKMSFAGYAVA
ncbi:MAG TPA: MoxR family ATPase [Verrucomicrobiales bacterium]|nr:MoxR family ATPase [Verrucomicrobiales bacterium]